MFVLLCHFNVVAVRQKLDLLDVLLRGLLVDAEVLPERLYFVSKQVFPVFVKFNIVTVDVR